MSRKKPLLIYDGDCNFCRRWIARWRSLTGDQIEYVPYQQVKTEFPQITEKQFESAVQFIGRGGETSSGAEAVFRTLAYSSGKRWLLGWYQKFLPFRLISEWTYKFVARHRGFFSFLTRCVWGNDLEPPQFSLASQFFLRVLGVIYAVAFLSLSVQILGLIGKNGILPAQTFLDIVSSRIGPERFWIFPTFFWIHAGDFFLQFIPWAGAALAVFLVMGFLRPLVLFLLWFFYLSLYTVGRDFLSFQWDILLLETGFLAIFLSPRGQKLFSSGRLERILPHPLVHWLFRWLLFRLVFFSGMVKLASGDPVWRNLTALQYHYATQPLPTWIGWYAHQAPVWFHQVSCAVMFAIELVIPFFIFGPKRLRLIASGLLIALQLLIVATGNYCFFNWLTIALCLLLIDDNAWPWKPRMGPGREKEMSVKPEVQWKPWPRWLLIPLAGMIFVVSAVHLGGLFRLDIRWPRPLMKIYQWQEPFQLVNSYGLFAVMTTRRPEIIMEGSNDGISWKSYEFRFKPGQVKKRPGFVAPHQPRLDWQMWFAALGDYQQNPWFVNLCVRLLEGSRQVLSLLEINPFPDHPPRFIRASLYEYHFADQKALKTQGVWWRRKLDGIYFPEISLQKNRLGRK